MDALSSKALWALYELYASSGAGKTGPPRKGVGAGRSGTPGPARGASQPPALANQAEVGQNTQSDADVYLTTPVRLARLTCLCLRYSSMFFVEPI